MMDATCTWSKEIDNTNMEDNQNFTLAADARGNNHSLTDPTLNRRLAYATCRTGWSERSSMTSRSEKVRRWKHRRPGWGAIAGGWQLGGALVWQTGFRLPSPARAMARR